MLSREREEVPEAPRVLIATTGLSGRGGTDLYARDLALALLRFGWLPIVYSTQSGPVADELRRATIPVVGHLDDCLAQPDIIHGQHTVETLAALTRFPEVPAVFFCHDSLNWHSIPPHSPRIRAYIAVDRNCRDRMMFEHGIPEESIRVLTNSVDLRRFAQRPPLPAVPRRAVVFSNAARENTWAAPIRSACTRRGIELDVIGESSGHFVARPEETLRQYDVVFAKARCALEGLAVGASVIVCDHAGFAGMVTTHNRAQWQQLNFGTRTLQHPITAERVLEALEQYDPADAAIVTQSIRAASGADVRAAELIALYEEVLSVPTDVSAADVLHATSRSLERLLPHLYRSQPPSKMRAMAGTLANVKALALPVRIVHRLRRWLRR
jgi:hypothetical protein